ncbi:molybdopterin molybdotransferase MoeA [Roseovarius sp. SCSIO 43702]|uniref:molybdopterin molybdotransferase MoeA n=1 Tax=Roseovarius sp. SCSIO 43702 TaxID=2823043 RepID=UPI001C72B06F|nr:gephyrin-like molybdotransferase Glp [Roseovarius sp. SCSIO 43702]QYX58363.1 molybdopterin molybdotransferase MoeA [Roseovarius sp. SCSIO 43702]
MIPVEQALSELFALVSPTAAELVDLRKASGRVLARPVSASRAQPPFSCSAMDGYALAASAARPGAHLRVIGEAAAGRRFEGRVGDGECVRIFTGAPMPEGTDRVVIQEDVTRDGEMVALGQTLDDKTHVRPAGADFAAGATMDAPRRLGPSEVALLAAMNVAEVPVHARPTVAIMATGDELVMPGESPGPDQIIASNSFGLKALLAELGAEPRLLPIARDSEASLRMAFDLARGADLVVTIGGASVGDHDLVGPVAQSLGLDRSFYKIAMRPGKPLMAGRMGEAAMIGLPGNPVSAMVCGHVFLAPVIRAMQGLPAAPAPRQRATLAAPLAQNGPREHYMRARVEDGRIRAHDHQDSALLTVLADANALLVRPPQDPARDAGAEVEYLPL